MNLFPKVQSPCPYKGKFADIMQGNQCRLCKREVVDLTEMSSEARQQFLSACNTEVCISYRVGAASALAAMAMSTAALPSSAAAQDAGDAAAPAVPVEAHSDLSGTAAKQSETKQADAHAAPDAEDSPEMLYIIVGGMRKPDQAEWVADTPADNPADTGHEKPPLPVEYDDETPAES